jgi:DNA (cytosine-5)-methyltransferase 1
MAIAFSDLFSGIGGFHAVGHAFGWDAAYACDIDADARRIYELNWGLTPSTDIALDANDQRVRVPCHEILFAGFPCQPFSKSGKQNGMNESRGTLFWNIARILEVRKPKLVLLENVPNLAGPRHKHEWEVIIGTLRELGYRVSDVPLVVSPHNIAPSFGGRPQTRSRIYIGATYVPVAMRKNYPLNADQLSFEKFKMDWDSKNWRLLDDIRIDKRIPKVELERLRISDSEREWLNAWDDFLTHMLKKRAQRQLPGFPFWADVWLGNIKAARADPDWKKDFISKNQTFYEDHQREVDAWLRKHDNLESFPPSRRKFEWQAGDNDSIWTSIVQLRPSGIRVKKMNYVPTAVAITQTTVVGVLERRLTVKEVTRLQGLPEWFTFGDQSNPKSYRQLGNAISLSTAYLSIKALVERDRNILLHTCPEIVSSVERSPDNPDTALRRTART